jgi:hypothetical protein
MAEPRLIARYRAELAKQLPGPVVEELADGLAQTQDYYLRQGQTAEQAAAAAVAEFGEPQAIVAAFAREHPARRAARWLLAAGPAVGACWVLAMLSSRAWPVALPGLVLIGVALVLSIGLLATAARGTRYRLAARTGTAGCTGVAVIDAALIITVLLAGPPLTWLTVVAMAASAARLSYAARALRPFLAA